MPEAMDGFTQQGFEGLGLIDDATRARFAAAAEATAVVVAGLEAKYADRGLHFSVPFYGLYPVQAFGILDGLRFYFRFRHSSARLDLGPYDAEIEQLHAQRMVEASQYRQKSFREKVDTGEWTAADYEARMAWEDQEERVTPEQEPHFLPTRLIRQAYISDWDEGGEYAGSDRGWLDDMETDTLFTALVDDLQDVPEAEQIDERTRILLYEGWDAVTAYDDAWRQRFMDDTASS